MPRLSLSLALARNPRTEAILSGAVAPEGIDWYPSGIHPSEMFWRQLHFKEFDVSEMSLASLAMAEDRGLRDWVPIPVFTTRRFFHTGIVVRADAGIFEPGDLIGRNVGVPEYQQTAAVWTRGALQHEFGVPPQELRWFMERQPELSHGGALSFTPPEGVDLSYVPPGSNLGQLLEQGTLDAAIVYIVDSNLIDRSRASVGGGSRIRRLFGDQHGESIRYYRKTGILPVNHTVVIRRELMESHPWVALNIYAAFVKAKAVAADAVLSGLAPWHATGVLTDSQLSELSAADPIPYGLAAQQKALTALSRYLFEQGLTASPVDLPGLFPASTREL